MPVQGRGGGTLDGFIDWWHRRRAHARRRPPALPEGRLPRRGDHDGPGGLLLERPLRLRAGRRRARGPLPHPPRVLALSFGRARRPRRPCRRARGPSRAAEASAEEDSWWRTFPLSGSFDLYAGLGFTAQDPGPVRRRRVRPAAGRRVLALEWRPSATVQPRGGDERGQPAGREHRSLPGSPLDRERDGPARPRHARTRLDLGFTENIWSQLTTTDFALYVGLGFRP